jgi:hypothetical protein
MQKRSRRITDVAKAMLGLLWCIGEQDIRRLAVDERLASA